ncbi:MAG TPA: family 16 glycoside hydrolase, partial [Gemmataceae bacterium]|nr:family 16 glycoside hydrolase [Gemmataceae bacterium]
SHEAAGSFLAEPAVVAPEPGQAATCTLPTDASPTDDETLGYLAPPRRADSIGGIGHYEVLQVMGQGGFGTVLKAFDEKLHRVVAIKVLSPAFAANGAARKRFIREARAAAAVKNEHVVGIYDVQEDAQPPYLVMECIDGVSLQDKIDRHGPLGVTEILRIGLQTAEGLAAAHKQGLVHRDIKPANILLENGVERVKLTDFGLARAVDDASITQSGAVAGTPTYMSPEQAEGFPVDHRSDLFSLGTVLYAMCTGHPPFRASGTHAVLKRVIEDEPRPVREINDEIPDWLCDIIAKLHAKKPEDRIQTAKEVGDLLGQHLADLQRRVPGRRPEIGTPPPARRPPSVEKKIALARLTSPAIGLTISGVLYWLAIPVFVLLVLFGHVDVSKWTQLDESSFNFLWVRLALLPAFAGFLLIFAGRKMRHGEMYWMCVLGACLPFALMLEKLVTLREHRFAMGPGDWTALPFGMWALIVLSRRDVRAAFLHPQQTRAEPTLLQRVRASRQRRIAALITTSCLLLLIAVWCGPSTVRYLRNRATLEIVPEEGLGGIIVLQNDATVTDWLGMQIRRTVEVSPGKYKLNPGCKPGYEYEGMSWQLTTVGIIADHTVRQSGTSCELELHRGERVIIRAIPRRTPPPVPGSVAAAHGNPDAAVARTSLDGQWVLVAAEHEGRPVPLAEAKLAFPSELRFQGDQYGLVWAGQRYEATVKTAPSKVPAEIDFLGSIFELPSPMKGIYKVAGDRLEMCLAFIAVDNENRPRPTAFRTDPQGKDALLTYRREAAPVADAELGALRDLVAAKERERNMVKTRFDAGTVNPLDMQAAEVELTTARLRLAEAEQDRAAIVARLEELVAHRKEERRIIAVKADVGAATPDALDKADGRLAEAQAQVAKARSTPDKITTAEPGWVQLFNGHDLTGWQTHPDQPGDWRVENGVLIGRGPRSHLFSERGNYENFHLRVEAQINNHGNSGVYFRSEYGLGWGVHPKGYEAQIFEGDAEDPYKTGSLYSLAKVTSDLVKSNTWFTLQVIAQGNRIIIKVDGKTAVDFVDEASRYKKGHFALQVERPGTIAQFRKIEVKELPPGQAPSGP